MRPFEDVGEKTVAFIVAIAAAVISMIVTFVGVLFLGARLFSGEASYGFGLAYGPVVSLITGAITFVLAYRKIRST